MSVPRGGSNLGRASSEMAKQKRMSLSNVDPSLPRTLSGPSVDGIMRRNSIPPVSLRKIALKDALVQMENSQATRKGRILYKSFLKQR